MKTAVSTVSVILLLSTLIWVGVYWQFPEAPLKPRETLLVVCLCTVATAIGQYAWRRWQNRHRKESDAAHK